MLVLCLVQAVQFMRITLFQEGVTQKLNLVKISNTNPAFFPLSVRGEKGKKKVFHLFPGYFWSRTD